MKGVTPIIAVVLLLLIVIALAGFAFVWFQTAWKTMATAAEQQMTQQQASMMKTIKIDNIEKGATNTTIYVRHTGSLNISISELAVYIDNTLATCTWSADILEPNTVITCIANLVCSNTVKVSAPGSEDAVQC